MNGDGSRPIRIEAVGGLTLTDRLNSFSFRPAVLLDLPAFTARNELSLYARQAGTNTMSKEAASLPSLGS
jgi:hypothetical protein